MRQLRAYAWVLAFSLCSGAYAADFKDEPFSVIENVSKLKGFAPLNILYKNQDTAIVRSRDASADAFQDLYVIDAGNMFALPASAEQAGEVLFFQPGRFAIMRVTEQKIAQLSASLHGNFMSCGGIMSLTGVPQAQAIAGTPTPMLPVNQTDARVQGLATQVQPDRIRIGIEELSAIPTRYHTTTSGQGVAAFLAQKYELLRGVRTDVEISTYDHGRATPQDSLVVRIKGKTRPNEVVILGSHIDSVNWEDGTSQTAPGADDNASGTATNMEVFRLLMESGYQPARTLEIHGYAAEEIGLVGSQNMANAYKTAGVNVIAMMQHDMTLWRSSNESDKIWLVTNNAVAGFNDQLSQLIDRYTGLPWEKAFLSGGSSDHQSWYRAGYATAFPFENPNNYNHAIHTADDVISNARSFNLAAGFAKLGVAYVMHYAGVE